MYRSFSCRSALPPRKQMLHLFINTNHLIQADSHGPGTVVCVFFFYYFSSVLNSLRPDPPVCVCVWCLSVLLPSSPSKCELELVGRLIVFLKMK